MVGGDSVIARRCHLERDTVARERARERCEIAFECRLGAFPFWIVLISTSRGERLLGKMHHTSQQSTQGNIS
jgi:hypothetical protein